MRILTVLFALLYGIGYVFFYLKYVPQILSIQLILVPLILFSIALTSFSLRFGTLYIIFLVPLVNSIPYFFNFEGFNPLFFIFLGNVLGILIHQIIHPVPLRLNNPFLVPMFGVVIVLALSAFLTFWRYSNLFPVYDTSIREFSVNVLNVSAGEAIRRVFFDSLNYMAGFIWFLTVLTVLKTKKMIQKAIVFLAASTFFSFAFGLYQALKDSKLGNTEFFIAFDQINALFTDPNAFGVFLTVSTLLFACAFMTFKTKWKPLFFLVLLGGLFLLPHSGSRSAFFGIALSLVFLILFLVKMGINQRRNIRRLLGEPRTYIAILLIMIVLFSFLVSFSSESSMYKRIAQNLKALSKKEAHAIILYGREQFWQSAYYMVKEYPLSGIGVGAFTCELPNFYKKYNILQMMPSSFYKKIPPQGIRIDSAGNYYLHIASELGFIGLFFFCWIFYLILRHIYLYNFKKYTDMDWVFLRTGLSVSVIVLFLIFVFGVHTLSFEIQLILWLIVGLLLNITPSRKVKHGPHRTGKILTGLLIGIFGLSYAWNSFHGLSIQSRTEEFNLPQEFGFYAEEEMNGKEFRWTEKSAGTKIQVKKPILNLPIHASHPDIQTNPVEVEVYSSKDLLKSKKLLKKFALEDNSQHYFEFSLSEELCKDVLLLFKVSRTWQPIKSKKIPDERDLGIGIGKLEFHEWPLASERKAAFEGGPICKFASSSWRGEQGGNLFRNGRCWIDVSLPKGNSLIRISARGQNARGEWPYMVIFMNDEMIGGEWVESDFWEFYCFRKELEGGHYRIAVEFINDLYSESPKEDRNLFVGDLEIFQLK